MAKKGRKKKKQLSVRPEVYAILFIIAAIVGIGKLGIVGKVLVASSIFLTGTIYIVFLILLFILGIYIFINGDWPEFFSTKMLGFYLFIIGLLTFLHWDFILDLNGNASLVFKKTLTELVNISKTMLEFGTINNISASGGGIIGGVFAIILSKLFAYRGMQIVSIILMIGGVSLFTGFSIVDFLRNQVDVVKEKKEEHDSKKQKDEEDESRTKVKISNGSEEYEEQSKQTISREDLKNKLTPSQDISNNNENQAEENPSEELHINANYQLPPLDLLNKPKKKNQATDNAAITANIEKLEKVLESFNVTAKVVEVHIGPTVSQYELEIATGTRVNKITTLNREIALALSKKDVRIEAPIPGKNTVGIEFANDVPSTVNFIEIMDSKIMRQSPDRLLMVPLGKSIMGEIGVCEINKMPHMLIAGTTGSGKSVCVNGIICSILMRAKPDEVKLAMVDPKVVELSCYNGIPHLICPVVSDPKQASILLKKMVEEMEKRYHQFSDTGTKKIEGYNEYIEKWNKSHPNEQKQKMPFIVVIIDELSDLMMVAAKEVEDSILRITQKARAAGIHLIVATQRPSTEVITGLIKANIPSRIAFSVGSGIDSRTILDQIGAEKLLGKGDMLFLPIGQNSPTRIQGSFITDDEIQRIIDFTKSQQEAQYIGNFTKLEEEKEEVNEEDLGEGTISDGENLYDEIVDFVIKQQKASASLLQRKFKIGYNKAATMIDKLEEDGIIGPATGNSKPREVLVQYSEKDE